MNWKDILGYVGDFSIILGALIFGVCAVGVLKFRDIYTRLSVIGTAGGSGIILVLFGVWLQDPEWLSGLKMIGAIILLLGTSALGSILIARAALLRRTPMIQPIYDDTKLLSDEEVT